jgi:molybdenum cofactor synthesis domain-containing protein
MRPFTSVVPIEDALGLLSQTGAPVTRTEKVGLAEALGRVVAVDVRARADVPAFARAAMDGYAAHAADLAGATADRPVTLTCTGAVYAGQPPPAPLTARTCVEIATGAPVPPGDDIAVVMVEETSLDGDGVRFVTAPRAGHHVTQAGSDVTAGQVVVAAGDVATPARIGAVAATGVAQIEVFARPRVAIVSTGNELVMPGAPLAPGQIYEINAFTLAAVVASHGGTPVPLASAGDSLEAIGSAFDAATDCDLIVFSGGSSVGERDLLVDVLRERGEVLFHGVAVKPGKPTALATAGRSVVLAMPGNPTSCLSNAYIFLVPLLRRLARLPAHRPRQLMLPLAARVASARGRHQFYTVRVVDGRAVPAFKGSGDISSMSQADGYIEIPAEVDALDAGTTVTVTLF